MNARWDYRWVHGSPLPMNTCGQCWEVIGKKCKCKEHNLVFNPSEGCSWIVRYTVNPISENIRFKHILAAEEF